MVRTRVEGPARSGSGSGLPLPRMIICMGVASWFAGARHRRPDRRRAAGHRCYHPAEPPRGGAACRSGARRRGGAARASWGRTASGASTRTRSSSGALLRVRRGQGPLQFVNLLSYCDEATLSRRPRAGRRRAERCGGVRPLRGGGARPRGAAAAASSTLYNDVLQVLIGRTGPWDQIAIMQYPEIGHVRRHDPGPGLPGGLVHRDAGLAETAILVSAPAAWPDGRAQRVGRSVSSASPTPRRRDGGSSSAQARRHAEAVGPAVRRRRRPRPAPPR